MDKGTNRPTMDTDAYNTNERAITRCYSLRPASDRACVTAQSDGQFSSLAPV